MRVVSFLERVKEGNCVLWEDQHLVRDQMRRELKSLTESVDAKRQQDKAEPHRQWVSLLNLCSVSGLLLGVITLYWWPVSTTNHKISMTCNNFLLQGSQVCQVHWPRPEWNFKSHMAFEWHRASVIGWTHAPLLGTSFSWWVQGLLHSLRRFPKTTLMSCLLTFQWLKPATSVIEGGHSGRNKRKKQSWLKLTVLS